MGFFSFDLNMCAADEGNHGCEGGLPDKAFQYILKNGGIDTEASYPYQAHVSGHVHTDSYFGSCSVTSVIILMLYHQDEKCRFNVANVGANMTSFKDIASKNESALQVATATVGPISVGIDASHISFKVTIQYRQSLSTSQCRVCLLLVLLL